MPPRPKRPCYKSGCPNTHRNANPFCDEHQALNKPRADNRASAASRGYGPLWRAVRAKVLSAAGIPRDQWPLYAVDHRPPYDAKTEPDHNKYALTPMLKANHNRKTAKQDGGFGR